MGQHEARNEFFIFMAPVSWAGDYRVPREEVCWVTLELNPSQGCQRILSTRQLRVVVLLSRSELSISARDRMPVFIS